MVLAGIVVDLLFTALGLVPTGPRPPAPMVQDHFAWNYTTWLDLAALAVMAALAFFHFKKSPPAQAHEEESPVHPHHETAASFSPREP
jgi:hypothetical protein